MYNITAIVVEPMFGIADYAVFAAMLAVSALIGMYYAFVGGKQETTAEFLMGDRSMGVFPVAMSLLASFLSAISLLGIPVEVYQFGTSYWTQLLVYPLIMYLTSSCFIPVFYNLGLTSSYEYLEKRFSKPVRTLGSALFIVQMVLYMAIVLYAPSLALAQVTGLNVWVSVLSIGIVCTFYTSIGGMKAVIWTDVFQTVMMFASMLLVLVKGVYDAGGLGRVYDKAVKTDRIEFFNADPNPLVRHTVWSVLIGSLINWTAVYGTNQAMVQRYLSIPTLAQAKRSVWVVLPMVIVLISILCGAGLVLHATYDGCDPVSTHRVSASDQLFPLFVMDTLGNFPGIPGLFVAGIFSGALSTVSSGVNSLAATTLEDFVRGYFFPDLSEKRATFWTKAIAVFYGLLSIALVAVAERMGNVLTAALALFGLLGAPVFALFVLGMFFTSTNAKGAFWGTILGIMSSMWVGIGGLYYKPYHPKKPMFVDQCSNLTSTFVYHDQAYLDLLADKKLAANEDIFILYRLSYMYYGLVGAGVTIIAGLAISHITGARREEDTDPGLFIPLIRSRLEKKKTSSLSIGTCKSNCGHRCDNSKSNNNLMNKEPVTTLQVKISSQTGKRGVKAPVSLNGVINIAFEPDCLRPATPSVMVNRHRNYNDLKKADNGDIRITQL